MDRAPSFEARAAGRQSSPETPVRELPLRLPEIA